MKKSSLTTSKRQLIAKVRKPTKEMSMVPTAIPV
jgi:hypothetical protein